MKRRPFLSAATAAAAGALLPRRATAQGAADGWRSASEKQIDSLFAVHQGAADVAEGISVLVDQLKTSSTESQKTGFHISSLNEDGRKLLDTTQQLAGTIADDLGAELKNSQGDYDIVRQKAGDYREELVRQMTQAGTLWDWRVPIPVVPA